MALPSTPVRQVLMNLLLNAVQAALEGGFVYCRVSRVQGTLTIDVVNNGRALSGEQFERLFEPFNSVSGHGLGLWVTYQIVQQLGGTIQASANQGETRFHVALPEREQA
jgi:signal transduction histidine kinase